VRDELMAEHPELAGAVFRAFEEAKDCYVERLCSGAIEAPTTVDRMHLRVAEITGADPLPYGVEPNRGVLEELIDHALAQKILRERPHLDSLFAAVGARDCSELEAGTGPGNGLGTRARD